MDGSNAWFWMALFAAMSWGIAYPLGDKVLKAGLDPIMMVAITCLIQLVIAGGIAAFRVDFSEQADVLSNKRVLLFLFLCATTYVIGSMLIYSSISVKNASLSSLIEMSYPLFTVFFAWLFFREFHLNLTVAFGSLLILGGVAMIYLKG